jgi:predicted nucleic acid-binding protein
MNNLFHLYHTQKNPIFAYLLAYNRKNEYRVIQEYITYDFETVMKKEIQKISDKTFSYAQQLPLSVAYYINDSKTSKFI